MASVRDLAALTPIQAAQLNGKQALFRVKLDSEGVVALDCVGADDTQRSVFLYAGQHGDPDFRPKEPGAMDDQRGRHERRGGGTWNHLCQMVDECAPEV